MAIRDFARARGLVSDPNVFLGKSSAFDALQRGAMLPRAFPAAAVKESQTRGYAEGVALGGLGWAELMLCLSAGSVYRPAMLLAIRRLRAAGIVVAALTNNIKEAKGSRSEEEMASLSGLVSSFDIFLESRVLGPARASHSRRFTWRR